MSLVVAVMVVVVAAAMVVAAATVPARTTAPEWELVAHAPAPPTRAGICEHAHAWRARAWATMRES